MPLGRLQSEILILLAKKRMSANGSAGGTVLHQHAFRLSDDQDFFHAEEIDVAEVAKTDVNLLLEAGYEVDSQQKHEGLYEAVVFSEGQHPAKLQWVQSGLLNFFEPVEDETFGWRIHLADLAVNKVLAAAGRKEVRDFVYLTLIHNHLVPLWHAMWAAPDKDYSWNPVSITNRIARNCQFDQSTLESAVDSSLVLDASSVLSTVRRALDDAESAFERLPPSLVGNLFVDKSGALVSDVDAVLKGLQTGAVKAVGPVSGGTLPSNPSIDRAMLESIIEEFGWEGSSIPDPY